MRLAADEVEKLLAESKASPSPMNMTTVLIFCLVCGAITLILCLFAMPICQKLDILDLPDSRKKHTHPTPLMGGIIMQLVVLPAAIGIALFDVPRDWIGHILIWATAVTAMTLVGLADDRHTLSARDRLLISFLVFGSAAILDSLFTVRVLRFEHPAIVMGLKTGWLAVIFTTVCGVGLVNAVNMADGKNGLVIGLCIIWLALLSFRMPQPLLPIAAILATAWAVLLFFNLRGRLFLGDGGAYGIATAIGLMAIATYNVPGNHASGSVSADELLWLFAVPIVDSFRLTFVRLYQGRSPMSADRDHLHHHLQNRLGWPTGLLVYWLFAATPYLAAQLSGKMEVLGSVVVFSICALLVSPSAASRQRS